MAIFVYGVVNGMTFVLWAVGFSFVYGLADYLTLPMVRYMLSPDLLPGVLLTIQDCPKCPTIGSLLSWACINW